MDEPELIWHDNEPLRRPVLVVAFGGLFDLAGSATSAVTFLKEKGSATLRAEIDAEGFFDFTQSRPMVSLAANGQRTLTWPSNEIWAARTSSDHDLLLLSGIEPHLRWRTFCGLLVEVVKRCDVEMVVTLGSAAAMAPHTRPLVVTGSAANRDLAERLGIGRPSYEGPTGVVGVLNERLDRENVPVLSLRVGIPHYLPSSPNPPAVQALLRRFERVTGIPSWYGALDEILPAWRGQVDAAVANDPQVGAYVRQLEEQMDSDETLLPSGDDLAAEFEAFLREQQGE